MTPKLHIQRRYDLKTRLLLERVLYLNVLRYFSYNIRSHEHKWLYNPNYGFINFYLCVYEIFNTNTHESVPILDIRFSVLD